MVVCKGYNYILNGNNNHQLRLFTLDSKPNGTQEKVRVGDTFPFNV